MKMIILFAMMFIFCSCSSLQQNESVDRKVANHRSFGFSNEASYQSCIQLRDSGSLEAYKDEDGDGLINGLEKEFQTDPCDIDSDKDKLVDGFEVHFPIPEARQSDKTSPLKADSRGDGIIDSNRLIKGKSLLNYQIDWMNNQ